MEAGRIRNTKRVRYSGEYSRSWGRYEIGDGDPRTLLALALTCFLSCGASEVFAFGNEKIHQEVCMTRRSMTSCAVKNQLSLPERRAAGRVEVLFHASKAKQRGGKVVTRWEAKYQDGGGGVETLLYSLDVHPEFEPCAPLL